MPLGRSPSQKSEGEFVSSVSFTQNVINFLAVSQGIGKKNYNLGKRSLRSGGEVDPIARVYILQNYFNIFEFCSLHVSQKGVDQQT